MLVVTTLWVVVAGATERVRTALRHSGAAQGSSTTGRHGDRLRLRLACAAERPLHGRVMDAIVLGLLWLQLRTHVLPATGNTIAKAQIRISAGSRF